MNRENPTKMKKKNRTSIGLVLMALASGALLIPSFASAHPNEAGEDCVESRRAGRIEHKLRRMARHLELTDEQIDMIRPILRRHAPDPGTFRDLERRERREIMHQVRQAVRHDLEGVLTPDQLERLDAHFERRRNGRQRHGS